MKLRQKAWNLKESATKDKQIKNEKGKNEIWSNKREIEKEGGTRIETNEKAEMFLKQEGRERNGPLKEAKSIQSNATT